MKKFWSVLIVSASISLLSGCAFVDAAKTAIRMEEAKKMGLRGEAYVEHTGVQRPPDYVTVGYLVAEPTRDYRITKR